MAHRLIFTNTLSINTSLRQKFVVGSGVGSRNRSVYRALQNRASNNAYGKPCCNVESAMPNIVFRFDPNYFNTDNSNLIVFTSQSGGYYTINNTTKIIYGAGTITIPIISTLTNLVIYDNSLTILNCSQNYNNLAGLTLGNLSSLQELYCYDCNLTTLDVSTLVALAILDCGANNFGTAGLTLVSTLQELYCYNCNLTTLDVSALAALTFLDCGGNNFGTTGLTLVSTLQELYCSYCNLTTLDVSTLAALTILYCGSNNFGTAGLILGNLSALQELNCENCNFDQSQADTIVQQIITIIPQVQQYGSLYILIQQSGTLSDTTPDMLLLKDTPYFWDVI
jgi:hypothetical protein